RTDLAGFVSLEIDGGNEPRGALGPAHGGVPVELREPRTSVEIRAHFLVVAEIVVVTATHERRDEHQHPPIDTHELSPATADSSRAREQGRPRAPRAPSANHVPRLTPGVADDSPAPELAFA